VMRLLTVLACVFVPVLAVAAQGQQKNHHSEAAIMWDGNQLYDLCQHYKTDKLKGSLGPGCFMYIAGAAETLEMENDADILTSRCPGEGVTDEKITDVVINWLEDHPEKRDSPAPLLVMKALTRAFPCQ
jgi:hypothetical protein